jgi:DNA polymerase-1
MHHLTFNESDKYPIALLVKPSALKQQDITVHYLTTMQVKGVLSDDVVAIALDYDVLGKATAFFIKESLSKLLPELQSLGVTHLYVTDSAYFKALTKEVKAEPHYGYVLPCKVKDYEHFKVVLGVNYQALIHNPVLEHKLNRTLAALCDSVSHNYTAPGSTVVHLAHYPTTLSEIEAALANLHQYSELTCDIEAFSLKYWKAGIGSIAFAWNQHNGVAFLCDFHTPPFELTPEPGTLYGSYVQNHEVRKLLFTFFSTYQGCVVWHNAAYDLKAIIHALWEKDTLDTAGMLDGLEVMTQSFHDTKIMAYLATNSTAGNDLKLKSLAHEFSGNWAQDNIKDIRLIDPDALLQYNLIDALSTFYIYKKFKPVLVEDKQQDIYENLMLPSLKTIIQMEMSGMPMNLNRVEEVKQELTALQDTCIDTLTNSPVIKTLNLVLKASDMEKANAKLKKKQHTLDSYPDKVFNPNSGPQVQVLLYEQMGLPVLDFTDTKQPAVGGDTLEKLVNHTSEVSYKEILLALISHAKVSKILSSFIPAFEKALVKGDGWAYLHGNFNLGGTVSGRLSSSDPNLQNIPAGSTYAKLIKSCFKAPSGWLFAGADFNSLEDYISALTTKDKNKLAVYEQGFDGHSLRAAYYYRDQLPHIDLDCPKSVNSIKKTHPELRQDSKAGTFLLTYGGTYHGMMSNLGWDKEKSQRIEANYHELYKESDQYVHNKLVQASKDGYVEVAFGLRVRTPLLKQVVFGAPKMPFEAAAEGRTAGNALGQSYGLLNNRAANAFMDKVRKSPYRLDIKLVALIHDAIYLMIRDCVEVVEWVNDNLIAEMQWQELPELQHPTVKLGAAMDIFWPTWATAITLPNNSTKETIKQICKTAKLKESQ